MYATGRQLVTECFPSVRKSFAIGFAICHGPVCTLQHHFVTRIQREHINAFYHLNFTKVHRAGKKSKETASPAEIRLETTAVVHRAATLEPEEEPTALDQFWKAASFICIFFIDDQLATSHQPVSVQLQLITVDSPTNYLLSSNSYKTIAVFYGEQLPINRWQVTKPTTDWSAIIPLFQIWA